MAGFYMKRNTDLKLVKQPGWRLFHLFLNPAGRILEQIVLIESGTPPKTPPCFL